jgi:RNA polymerase sigma-70 factor (sigma-E family)
LAAKGGSVRESADGPARRDEAVTALFVAHHARLVGLAYLLVDDVATAEDVVQDAFTALYRRWSWVRDHGAALAYLQTSVVNGARSNLRRRARRTRESDRDRDRDRDREAPSPESTVVAREDERRLEAALLQLPIRQRQVLVLRYYLDQSEAEIASTLSISRGTVKQHASRALAALHLRLEASL